MKKIICLLLTALLICGTMVFSTKTSYASEVTTPEVITDVVEESNPEVTLDLKEITKGNPELTTDETIVHEFTDNNFVAYFNELETTYGKRTWKASFTIDETSIVTLNAAGEGIGWYNDREKATIAVYKDSILSSVVIGGNAIPYSVEKPAEMKLCLEPGKYYVSLSRDGWSSLGGRKGFLSARVTIDAVDTIESVTDISINKAISMKKAYVVKSGVENGTLNTDNKDRNYFYKIKLTRKGRVSILTLADKINDIEKNNNGYKISVLDAEGVAIKDGTFTLNGINEIEKSEITLKKGTYYIKVDFKDTNYAGATTFKATIKYVPATPSKIIATNNDNKVTGSTTKNTNVYVTVSGKKYNAKSNSKGNFTVKTSKLKKGTSVKVYAKNAIGNSAVKTVKVK